MATVEESILIPAPPETVYDYILDPSHLPEYSGMVISAELEGPGPVTVGSRVHGVTKVLGRKINWVAELTEDDRPNKQVVRSTSGKIEFTEAFTLAPEGEGTLLTYRLEAAPGLGGLFGKLADAMVGKVYSRQIQTDLHTLSEILTVHEGEAS